MIEAILGAAVAILGSFATNAYYYGRLTKTVDTNTQDIAENKSDIRGLQSNIGSLDTRVTVLERTENNHGRANGAHA